jgi:ATP-dependent Clp protease protease subunit
MFPFLNTPAAQAAAAEPKLKDGFVTLYGDVDEVSAKHVVDEIQRLNRSFAKTPIYLFINSPGGLVSSGGLMISAIKNSKRPVYTVCVELCASMAAITHAYGAKRYMLEYATLMYHEAAYGVQGQLTHNRSRERWSENQFARFEEEVAARAGIAIDEFRSNENKEWWVLSAEAAARHLNDCVYTEGDFPAPKE